jgi:membrane associated rhomboid family serine protease
VTVTLIAINAAVWIFYQLPDQNHALAQLAYQPCEVNDSCPPGGAVGEDWPITAVTSMFMHGGWLHLIGNMLFLWIFGNNVEDSLGHFRFLLFYFLGGFAATGLQTFVTLAYGTPGEGEIPNVGASGAISAVLGAYLVILPRASVVTAIFVIIIFIREFPAWIFLGVWFALQAWSGGFSLLHPEEGGGIAFFAHIGGFLFGVGAMFVLRKRQPLRPAY